MLGDPTPDANAWLTIQSVGGVAPTHASRELRRDQEPSRPADVHCCPAPFRGRYLAETPVPTPFPGFQAVAVAQVPALSPVHLQMTPFTSPYLLISPAPPHPRQ